MMTWYLVFEVLMLSTIFFYTSYEVKIRVGHIGAINAMPYGDKILNISRKDLWDEGVLADDFDIE